MDGDGLGCVFYHDLELPNVTRPDSCPLQHDQHGMPPARMDPSTQAACCPHTIPMWTVIPEQRTTTPGYPGTHFLNSHLIVHTQAGAACVHYCSPGGGAPPAPYHPYPTLPPACLYSPPPHVSTTLPRLQFCDIMGGGGDSAPVEITNWGRSGSWKTPPTGGKERRRGGRQEMCACAATHRDVYLPRDATTALPFPPLPTRLPTQEGDY